MRNVVNRPAVASFWWRHACVALALLCVLLIATPAMACPNCKDTLANGSNSMNLVRGYFWSIVFMMSMPFLILGGLGTYFYLEVRRARRLHGPRTIDLGALELANSRGRTMNSPA